MSSQPRVVPGALPPKEVAPLEPGAKGYMDSVIIKQNNQANLQNSLAGNKQSGGKKHYRGGANPPVVQVVPASSIDPNKSATNANNEAIAKLAINNQNGAAYDGTVNGNPSDTAIIAAQQANTYYGTKGGSKSKSRKHLKKGGSWPVWGCLSGGKKSRKTRRSRRTRKSRKNVKRHRR